MSQQPTPDSQWRQMADVLLPGLAFVLGLQAWRLGVTLVADGRLPPGVALVPFAAAPLARAVGDWRGGPRAAAAAVLLLGLVRLAAQAVGPAAAPVAALLGAALFVAWLELWVATTPPPRAVLHGVLLGYGLSLADRVVTATLDLHWQAGFGPFALTCLLTWPTVALAGRAWSQAGPAPLMQSPTSLALPLLVVVVQLGVAHVSRIGAIAALPQPTILVWLGLAYLLAVFNGLGYERLHTHLLRRRARSRLARGLLLGLTLGFGLPVTAGLLWPQVIELAVILGPTLLTVILVGLLRARPVGRRRVVGEWSSLSAWGLAGVLSSLAVETPWPTALALLLLVALVVVAAHHPSRPEAPPAPPLLPAQACHLLLFAVLLTPWLAWRLAAVNLGPALREGALRLTCLDLSAPRATAPAELLERGRQVALLESRLVVVTGVALRDRRGFCDLGYRLARDLDLHVAGRRGDQVLLAAARPLLVAQPPAGGLAAVWALGPSGLGVGLSDGSWAGVLDRLQDVPRRLLVSRPGASGPPAGPAYQPVAAVVADPRPWALWAGRGLTGVPVTPPPRPPAPGSTTLLAIDP